MSVEILAKQVDLSDAAIRHALIEMMLPVANQAANQAVSQMANQAANPTASSVSAPNLAAFIAPPDLAAWNSLLGATQITKIAPLEVVLYGTIPSGAENQPVAYTTPANYVSTAMASFAGSFSYHSANLAVLGFLDYNTPEALPITSGPIVLENDLDINRVVTSGHQIRYNLTMLFTNATAYDVDYYLRTTFLQVPEGLFNQLYKPFELAVARWMTAITNGQYQGGPRV